MAVSELTGQADAGWDEAQCTAALARLEQLQVQIDNLRLAIPHIIEPLYLPPNPATFKLYAQGARSSQSGIESVRTEWKAPETQRIYNYTNKSFAANKDLSASTAIAAHGWIERDRKERESKKGTAIESSEVCGPTLTGEDVTRVVEEFTTNNTIKLELKDDNCTIATQFPGMANMLRLRVSIEREATGAHKLNAECLGSTEPFLSITRSIKTRPQANDLKYLLDMIAAYKTVKGLSCAKCGQLMSENMMTPTARRSRQVLGANESSETVWEAFHESCVD